MTTGRRGGTGEPIIHSVPDGERSFESGIADQVHLLRTNVTAITAVFLLARRAVSL